MSRKPFGWMSRPWLVLGGLFLTLLVLGLLLWSPWDRPGLAEGPPLRLYCAAGMARPVEEIIARYEKECGVSVEPTFAGTGELLAKLALDPGPNDLFLCAD